MLVEGQLEIERALLNAIPLEAVYVCEDFGGPRALRLAEEAVAMGAEVFAASAEAFAKASLRENPDGLLATAVAPSRTLADLPSAPGPALWVVVEGVEKPGNLGAVIRSANAAGATAVIATDGADVYAPQVIRNSRGLVFATPVVIAEREAIVAECQRRGLTLYAATAEAPTPLWDADLSAPVALVLGTEHEGLSPFWRAVGLNGIHIPMTGQADSLNVAATAAVVLFEAARQRLSRA